MAPFFSGHGVVMMLCGVMWCIQSCHTMTTSSTTGRTSSCTLVHPTWPTRTPPTTSTRSRHGSLRTFACCLMRLVYRCMVSAAHVSTNTTMGHFTFAESKIRTETKDQRKVKSILSFGLSDRSASLILRTSCSA